jgi:DHA1 family bicyclomycin/chloramphenicol resistance-like MFS transporter
VTGTTQTKRVPSIAQLVAFSALGPFGMHLVIPAIAPIREEFGVSAGVASLLISATLWGIAASTLFFGVLADRYGRRPALVVGIALYVVGSLMAMAGEDAAMVIAGRVIQGIGGSTGIVISRAVIRDLYSREKATSAIAYLTMVVMIAPIMAPAFAGYMVDSFGWRMVFTVAGAMGLLVLAWLVASFPETLKDPVPLPNFVAMLGNYVSVLRSRVFVYYSLVGTFIMTGFFAMMSGAPHVAHDAWRIAPDELGFYLGAGGLGMMMSTFITARIAERVDNNKMLLAGFACMAVGLGTIVLLFALGFNHPLSLFGPAVINGFGAGFCLPTSTSGALAETPRMAGTASGMMTFLQFAAAGVAAQAIGYFDHHTVWPVVGFMVVGNAVAAYFAFKAVTAAGRRPPS